MTRHRGLEPLCETDLIEAIAKIPSDHYVVWTGHPCGVQEGSLRSRALRLVGDTLEPVALRVLAMRAARLEGEGGFPPSAVRSAVRLHQAARPAVYLLVRQTSRGDFVAVTDIPFPPNSAPIREGDVVMRTRSALRYCLRTAAAG